MDKKPVGMAAASPETRKRVATAGGKAVQSYGTGHKFNSRTGRKAGKKGGAGKHKGK